MGCLSDSTFDKTVDEMASWQNGPAPMIRSVLGNQTILKTSILDWKQDMFISKKIVDQRKLNFLV
jgi:hypothetical protein